MSVWKVSGGFLEGVLRFSKGCVEVFGHDLNFLVLIYVDNITDPPTNYTAYHTMLLISHHINVLNITRQITYLYHNYCHTWLQFVFSAKLKIWQVPTCKMKPQRGWIMKRTPPIDPPTQNYLLTCCTLLCFWGFYMMCGGCLEVFC